MKTVCLLALALMGCGSDSADLLSTDGFPGDELAAGGSKSVVAMDSPGGAATVAVAGAPVCVDAPKPFCEPGKQVACACPAGVDGAQSCDGDGLGWGECKCAAPIAVEPVVETVSSGDCLRIGRAEWTADESKSGPCVSTYPILYVNCASAPGNGCSRTQMQPSWAAKPGVFCCAN